MIGFIEIYELQASLNLIEISCEHFISVLNKQIISFPKLYSAKISNKNITFLDEKIQVQVVCKSGRISR